MYKFIRSYLKVGLMISIISGPSMTSPMDSLTGLSAPYQKSIFTEQQAS